MPLDGDNGKILSTFSTFQSSEQGQVGSDAWDRLFGPPRPAELHPFREIRAGGRHAVSTPGDLLFHIRAKRAWIYAALRLHRRSWHVSEMRFHLWMKRTASDTLTSAIS
jgi:deferrochelatase/peroxidase EfeB